MPTYLFRKTIEKLPGEVIHKVPMPEPEVIEGRGVRLQIGALCKEARYKSVLLVTDTTLSQLGYHHDLIAAIEKEGIRCTLFSDIASEPTIHIVDAGRRMALQCEAECIIALGGGSVMDACKMIAAGARMRKLSTKALMLKFLAIPEKTLPLITLPTTAGTGAEITVGAIVKDEKGTKCSTVIIGLDVSKVILDCELTMRAPRSVTAACGIDALSHGLEGCVADVRSSDDDMTKSKECVKLVLDNLPLVLEQPDNAEARAAMCRAAHYGGNAINKQLAGYVHAFAHSIGARYHLSHGNAIAIALLPVMRFQKECCLDKLADVAVYCGLALPDDDRHHAADALIDAIDRLLSLCDFPKPCHFIPLADANKLVRMITADSINYSAPITLKNQEILTILDEINDQP